MLKRRFVTAVSAPFTDGRSREQGVHLDKPGDGHEADLLQVRPVRVQLRLQMLLLLGCGLHNKTSK